MSIKKDIREQMMKIISEATNAVYMLNFTPCPLAKNRIMEDMKNYLATLNGLINQIDTEAFDEIVSVERQSENSSRRDLTIAELSQYNGKNGAPAYVAVNGTIYDVTNVAAWAAATHFGLSAGHDLTQQFNSCHAGQPILSKLTVIGRLI